MSSHHHAAKEKTDDARAMLEELRSVNSIEADNNTISRRAQGAQRGSVKAAHYCGQKTYNRNGSAKTAGMAHEYMCPVCPHASRGRFLEPQVENRGCEGSIRKESDSGRMRKIITVSIRNLLSPSCHPSDDAALTQCEP